MHLLHPILHLYSLCSSLVFSFYYFLLFLIVIHIFFYLFPLLIHFILSSFTFLSFLSVFSPFHLLFSSFIFYHFLVHFSNFSFHLFTFPSFLSIFSHTFHPSIFPFPHLPFHHPSSCTFPSYLSIFTFSSPLFTFPRALFHHFLPPLHFSSFHFFSSFTVFIFSSFTFHLSTFPSFHLSHSSFNYSPFLCSLAIINPYFCPDSSLYLPPFNIFLHFSLAIETRAT